MSRVNATLVLALADATASGLLSPGRDRGRQMPAKTPMTSGYHRTALGAVERLHECGADKRPPDAWRMAAEQELATRSMREKGCPRGAFLGLCASGRVRGVPAGPWTTSRLNAEYAMQMADALQSDPGLAASPRALWGRCSGREKAMNGQPDVVIALWQAGYLEP